MIAPSFDESAALLRSAFDAEPFTAEDAARALGMTVLFWRCTLAILTRRGDVQKIATRENLLEYVPDELAADCYSFGTKKTEDDALEKIDPIPPDEITLDVQLYGGALKRYLELRERIFSASTQTNDAPEQE